MYYRFSNGSFVEADTFAEAKKKLIERIEAEVEKETSWHKCTCLGFDHRFGCPEKSKEITF